MICHAVTLLAGIEANAADRVQVSSRCGIYERPFSKFNDIGITITASPGSGFTVVQHVNDLKLCSKATLACKVWHTLAVCKAIDLVPQVHCICQVPKCVECV